MLNFRGGCEKKLEFRKLTTNVDGDSREPTFMKNRNKIKMLMHLLSVEMDELGLDVVYLVLKIKLYSNITQKSTNNVSK